MSYYSEDHDVDAAEGAASPPAARSHLPTAPDMPAVFASVLGQLRAKDTWGGEKLHASDLGATLPGAFGCLRKLWLRVHGIAGRPLEPGSALLLSWGTAIHRQLQAWLTLDETVEALAALGWRVEKIESSVEDESGAGTLDVLLVHESGVKAIWDIKTARGNAFYFVQKAAKPEAVIQVRHYMKKEDAQLGFVTYVDREGSRFMHQPPAFGRDDAAVEKAWTRARTNVERPEPPDPLAPKLTAEGPDLPPPCQYSTQSGDVVSCPYLDTEHCPGAVPRAERPKRRLVSAGMKWVAVQQPKAKEPPPAAEALDLMQALKRSLKETKK